MIAKVKISRVYDGLDPDDGYRVLVDRLWPRGLSKSAVHCDLWCKELAPTADLRRWFGHKAEHWDQFCQRYRAQLSEPEQVERMRALIQNAEGNTITLVYAAKDADHNQAVVLAEVLNGLY